jgi:uncharacterized protein YdaU (DUF1376 family)
MRKMKVRYVQLESESFLTDLDFIRMSAQERGVYCTLLFYLYCNNGRCELDPPTLARMCSCSDSDFEKIWPNISKKFQTRNGVIRHKRVSKELRRAKKFIQHQRKAGLASAIKRQPQLNGGSTSGASAVQPTETKGNVIEKESKALTNTNTSGLALSSSNSVRAAPIAPPMLQDFGTPRPAALERSIGAAQVQGLYFNSALTNIIRPRSQSDRTCFRNVTNWLTKGCAEGTFTQEIFARVLGLADEAKTGRKPAAVFMALLKKELGYKNEPERKF